jgi:integrase
MPRAKLTELSVSRLKPPKSGRLEVWDTILPAFGLRLTAAGGRSWVVALRKPGAKHPVRHKIGISPVMSLAAARAKARELLADPTALLAKEPARFATVESVAEEFITRHIAPNRRERSGREAAAQLNREFVAWYGQRPIGSIGRRDIVEALDRVADRGAPIAANRLLANLSRLFAWAVDRGYLEATPIISIRAPAKERSRDRVLENEELEAIWRASGQLGWPFGPIIRLLMVTMQRRDEVAHMAWPDLDFEQRLWRLPRSITKADRMHEVPLSPLAMEVIEGLPRRGDALAFPSMRMRSANPVSGFSRAKLRLDKLSSVTGWRVHDLRRTGASGIARLGHPPHVVAAILNHSPGSTMGVTAVYNRHRYTDEKRLALDAWGRELERVIGRAGGSVVALRA